MKVVVVLLALSLLVLGAAAAKHSAGKIGKMDPSVRQRALAIEQELAANGARLRDLSSRDAPSHVCMFGKPYEVLFNVTIPQDDHFVRVDAASGYDSVECNIDGTDMLVHFDNPTDASAFLSTVSQGAPILTGGQGKAECEPNYGMFRQVSFVNTTVEKYARSYGVGATYAVRLRTFEAKYDHVIKSGSVQFGPSSDPSLIHMCDGGSPTDPAHFCLGINTNQKCTAAAGPIIFYQNEYVTFECANCWLAFSMDVGLKMDLEDFLLYDSHFKFQNMLVQGALIAEMLAHYSWGVNYDATIPIIGPTTVVQFWLGPIPIIIGFELPLERVADASFDASAIAEAGAEMEWQLGDFQVDWNPVEGWKPAFNEPGLVYKTTVYGEAQFDGTANFGLAPSLQANLDSFFTAEIAFSAMLHANVQGSTTSMQICADVNYAVMADATATLEISIPWVDIDDSWTWTDTWFQESGTIAQACVSAHNMSNDPKYKDRVIPKQSLTPKKPKKEEFEPVDWSAPQLMMGDLPLSGKVPSLEEQHRRSKEEQERRRSFKGKTVNFQGSDVGCWNGRGYKMAFNYTMPQDYNLLNLATFDGYDKLDCNSGGSNFRIKFHDHGSKDRFLAQANPFSTFLTGDKSISDRCRIPNFETQVFMYRVLHVDDTSLPFDYQVEVQVSRSRYDEVFQSADMIFGPSSEVDCSTGAPRDLAASDHVCLGVNANADCNAAAGPLVMYENQYFTLECENCYFAAQTDVFFELHIRDFWVQELSGGFKNMSIDGAIVLELLAHIQWSAGTNITQDVVGPTTILDFPIGPIPVRLWFEIPLRRLAEVQVNIQASASAGIVASWIIGDNYVTYVDGQGWSHVRPDPVLKWSTYLGPVTAAFTATAEFGLIPTFNFHVDSVFWTYLTIDPEIHLFANGTLANRTVCASAEAIATATAYAQLEFNIPFIYVHMFAWWGPEVVYDSGVKPLASMCRTF